MVKGYDIYERKVRVEAVRGAVIDIEKISGKNSVIWNVWGLKLKKYQELNNARI